ncbi:CDP-glycerol glycerophosphotransferase family protein [Alkalimarinus alittae]|uniref:CDP-glycerol glycerophosphotransferase family protein n=1 Tax=Alkalimarinus alittae TaxID=2961619 RepID=A0ABY6MX21_9ALTE|nr:CDP-glycerol glycerophosphotransferase family protein [Alkalimarinus alittae]UZE94365.1 CDP-glycerol glycerophosphotransferase family protein [Alkalimarinus alittae]
MKQKVITLLKKFDDIVHENFGPIRVMFVITNKFGLMCQLPLIKQMVKDSRFKVYITSVNRPSINNPVHDELVDTYFISPQKASLTKIHYVIYTDMPHLYFKRNCLKVSMSHGAAFGITDYTEKQSCHPEVDIVFGIGRSFRDKIEEYKPGTISNEKKLFFPTGFMKTDNLINKKQNRDKILASLGLDPNKQTILIASHWTESSILRTLESAIAEQISTDYPDHNVIQTAHEKIWTNPRLSNKESSEHFDSQALINQLQRVEQTCANFKLVRRSQIQPLLSIADAFVTDLSSVIVEYSLLDRPILFYNATDEVFTDPTTLKLYKDASTSFTQIDEIKPLLDQQLQNPALKSVGRRALADYFLDNQGEATKASIETLLRMGRMSSRNSRKWRRALNLSKAT